VSYRVLGPGIFFAFFGVFSSLFDPPESTSFPIFDQFWVFFGHFAVLEMPFFTFLAFLEFKNAIFSALLYWKTQCAQNVHPLFLLCCTGGPC
jgi:TRAP-type mannitol/chloroaromatic compound transport system permease large subunit